MHETERASGPRSTVLVLAGAGQDTGVPRNQPEHVTITFTEHPGEDFHLSDRVLADWQEHEDSLA